MPATGARARTRLMIRSAAGPPRPARGELSRLMPTSRPRQARCRRHRAWRGREVGMSLDSSPLAGRGGPAADLIISRVRALDPVAGIDGAYALVVRGWRIEALAEPGS